MTIRFNERVVFDAAFAALKTFTEVNAIAIGEWQMQNIEELLELDPETSPTALFEVSGGKDWQAAPREIRFAFELFRETYVTLHRQLRTLNYEKEIAAREAGDLERRARTRQPERDVFERVGKFGAEKIGDERLGKQFTPAAVDPQRKAKKK